MGDVFISYAHKNKAFVHPLADQLEAQGVDVWLDRDRIASGTKWWEEIEKGIAAADNFAFVVSPQSLASPICMVELSEALQRGKRIIRIEHLPVEELPYAALKKEEQQLSETVKQIVKARKLVTLLEENWALLGHIQYVLYTPNVDQAQAFEQFIAAIWLDQAHKQGQTRLEARHDRWLADKKPDYLLHGIEVNEAHEWQKHAEAKNHPIPAYIAEYIKTSDAASREAQRKQRRLTTRQRRLLRFIGAALGTGVGFSISVFALFRSGGLQGIAQQLTTTLALGALFGVLLGAVILLATELPQWLANISAPAAASPKPTALLIGWAVSSGVCWGVFLFYATRRGTAEGAAAALLLLAAALFTVGFGVVVPLVASRRSINLWLRAAIYAAGVFLALYAVWQINPAAGLFYYDTGEKAVFLSGVFAAFSGLLTLLPEAFEDSH